LKYLVAGRPAIDVARINPADIVAAGGIIVFEGPWTLGAPVIARLADDAIDDIRTKTGGVGGYAVEALADPGAGEAFAIGAHRVHDPEEFRRYAAQVAAVVQSFGGRFLARGGKVTPMGGGFVPDRAVIIEFPRAADAVAFYYSDIYAPLLKIRHATTDPRFVLIARAGPLPAAARAAAENFIARHSH
jgi:uncharacterized protein (DUF1330 family)